MKKINLQNYFEKKFIFKDFFFNFKKMALPKLILCSLVVFLKKFIFFSSKKLFLLIISFSWRLMSLIYNLFLILIFTVSSMTKFPNIDYMRNGYNLLFGNPSPSNSGSLFDPGFTSAYVFEFEYTQNNTSNDGVYDVPDFLDVSKAKSCSYESETIHYFSEKNYYDSLFL